MKKIALNFIFKGNEAPAQILRMLQSIAPYVDAIYATATWTEEGEAVKIVKNFGGKVSFFKWTDDFSEARNFALKQIPDEFEYVLWLDTDDEFQGGKELKKIIQKGFDCYWVTYNYKIDPKSKEVLIAHPRERIFKKNLYSWKAPIHETAIAQGKTETVFSPDVFVNHFPDQVNEKEAMERNCRILEKQYKEEGDKHDPRNEYYLARQYFDMERWQLAEKLFWDYLKHSGWDEERSVAYNYLAELYRTVEKYDDAIYCLLEAIKEYPFFPTFYINLGVVYGKMENWDRALHFTKLGLSMELPKTAMVLSPRDDKVRALETIYFACVNKRMIKEAYASAEKLLEFFPDDETFQQRAKAMYDLQRWTDMSVAMHDVVKELAEKNETDKIESLLNSLPDAINENAFVEKIRKEYLPAKTWPEKSIVYFCGKGFEKWDESNLLKGIGGSETAVIQLSKWWVKQGYKVTVLGDPHKEHTDADGVEWRPYWKFNVQDKFDTLVIWRNETVLNAPIQANKVILDLHDVPFIGDYTPERLEKVNHIFVKSAYHRSLLPDVPDEKFVIIPNGVDLDVVKSVGSLKKRDNKLIYASSYDRGLDMMLEFGWPIIKEAIPDAELHIYYGWNLFDKVCKNNPERMMWKKKVMELMRQAGVEDHGRVAQKDLLTAKAESKIHYYGCTFEEIDCISVRESASVGCIPMTTNYASLKGKPYCIQTDGDPLDPETHKELARNIVAKLQEGKIDTAEFKKLAREESWENIANLWMEKIK